MTGNDGRRVSVADRCRRLAGILVLVTATLACDTDVASDTGTRETREPAVAPADLSDDTGTAEFGTGEIATDENGTDETATDETATDEIGTDELALRLPDGWDLRSSPAEDLVVLAAHPHHEWGRIGVIRVEGLNDVGLYVADTTTVGAALRGLEPELLRDEVVEVAGAREAQLVESVYSAPVEGRPRLRSLQLALRRTDDLGFDIRIELPEDAWEAGTADEVIRSVRLLEAPR